MDLNYTSEELVFRAEVRSFLSESLPERIPKKVAASQCAAHHPFRESSGTFTGAA